MANVPIVNVEISLRRNSDGIVRVLQASYSYCDDREEEVRLIEFMWSEGNYGCDCNRYLFFERAGCHEPTDEESELHCNCGEDRYTVLCIVDMETGKTIYAEGETPLI